MKHINKFNEGNKNKRPKRELNISPFEAVSDNYIEFLQQLSDVGNLARSTMSHSSVDWEDKDSILEEVREWKEDIQKLLSKISEIEEKTIAI